MSTYLTADEIIQAVRDKDLRIAYYSVPSGDGGVKRFAARKFVDPDFDPDDIDAKTVWEFFLNSLAPDSMSFHIGPYALVESTQRGSDKDHVKVRNGQCILNVSAAGTLTWQAGEFVLVGSNEYVEMSAKLGASLSSNVRNTDIGLSHISTIIDPSWQGVLQIGVDNPTSVSKQLLYNDPICVVRFHRYLGGPPAKFLAKFRGNRPHFGNDWWQTESDRGRPVFPVRKEYALGGEYERKIEKEKSRARAKDALKIGGMAVGVSGLVAAIFFLAQLKNRLDDLGELEKKIEKLEEGYEALAEISKTFHVIETGSDRISPDDKGAFTFRVKFAQPHSKPPSIFTSITGLKSSDYVTTIGLVRSSGARHEYTGARIEVQISDSVVRKQDFVLTWLVASPKVSDGES